MMSLRRKIFIIVSVSVGFLIFILLLIYLRNNQDDLKFFEDDVDYQISSLDQTGPVDLFAPTNQVITATGIVTQTPDEIYVKQLTEIFVERFNSYSNLNGNAHIDDVVVLSTEKMAEWLNSQRIDQSGQYQGFTTEVFASNIERISDEEALISFDAQQVSQTEGSDGTTLRSGFVELVKIGGEWKVDGFYWGD
jgi:hypothetical protein